MLELDHLTVSGDVTFGRHVILKVGGIKFLLVQALAVHLNVGLG